MHPRLHPRTHLDADYLFIIRLITSAHARALVGTNLFSDVYSQGVSLTPA